MNIIKPNKQFIVAVADEAMTITSTGILVPEQSRDDPKTAVILAVGDDVTGFKAGDRIIYKDYTTTEVKLDDVDYIVLEHIDVLGTIMETN